MALGWLVAVAWLGLSLVPLATAAGATSEEEKSFLALYFSDEELEVFSATRSLKSVASVAENVTVVTAAEIETHERPHRGRGALQRHRHRNGGFQGPRLRGERFDSRIRQGQGHGHAGRGPAQHRQQRLPAGDAAGADDQRGSKSSRGPPPRRGARRSGG